MNVNPSRLAFLLTLSFFVAGQTHAELKWEQTSIELHPNFGDKQAIAHFKYENIGKTPVRIKSATSSCGCTVAQSQKDEIPPGQKGEVTATFTIADRTGIQVKTIRVEMDDPSHPLEQLTLKTVIPELLTVTPIFVFWTTGEDPKPKTIVVKANKDRPAKNLSLTCSNAEFVAKVEQAGEGEWKIQVQPKETSRAMNASLTIRPEVPNQSAKLYYVNASVTGGPAPVMH
jgi:hypothetical protein